MADNILVEVLKDLKIDFSKTIVARNGGSSIDSSTEISPRDFIRFSKKDFKENDKKGLINSITNSKRAIDCQIDSTLSAFGISYDEIDKSSEEIIKFYGIDKMGLPFKLKLMQALGFVSGGLITSVRNLRHKLEHYYQVPKKSDVEQAIEIAELFCLSIESKTKIVEEVQITSEGFVYRKKDKKYNLENILYSNQLEITFNDYKKIIEVVSFKEKKKHRVIQYKSTNPEYYFIVRLLLSSDEQVDFEDCLRVFLAFIEHPIPSKNIKILEYY